MEYTPIEKLATLSLSKFCCGFELKDQTSANDAKTDSMHSMGYHGETSLKKYGSR